MFQRCGPAGGREKTVAVCLPFSASRRKLGPELAYNDRVGIGLGQVHNPAKPGPELPHNPISPDIAHNIRPRERKFRRLLIALSP